jgi:hypothetical protein
MWRRRSNAAAVGCADAAPHGACNDAALVMERDSTRTRRRARDLRSCCSVRTRTWWQGAVRGGRTSGCAVWPGPAWGSSKLKARGCLPSGLAGSACRTGRTHCAVRQHCTGRQRKQAPGPILEAQGQRAGGRLTWRAAAVLTWRTARRCATFCRKEPARGCEGARLVTVGLESTRPVGRCLWGPWTGVPAPRAAHGPESHVSLQAPRESPSETGPMGPL